MIEPTIDLVEPVARVAAMLLAAPLNTFAVPASAFSMTGRYPRAALVNLVNPGASWLPTVRLRSLNGSWSFTICLASCWDFGPRFSSALANSSGDASGLDRALIASPMPDRPSLTAANPCPSAVTYPSAPGSNPRMGPSAPIPAAPIAPSADPRVATAPTASKMAGIRINLNILLKLNPALIPAPKKPFFPAPATPVRLSLFIRVSRAWTLAADLADSSPNSLMRFSAARNLADTSAPPTSSRDSPNACVLTALPVALSPISSRALITRRDGPVTLSVALMSILMRSSATVHRLFVLAGLFIRSLPVSGDPVVGRYSYHPLERLRVQDLNRVHLERVRHPGGGTNPRIACQAV